MFSNRVLYRYFDELALANAIQARLGTQQDDIVMPSAYLATGPVARRGH